MTLESCIAIRKGAGNCKFWVGPFMPLFLRGSSRAQLAPLPRRKKGYLEREMSESQTGCLSLIRLIRRRDDNVVPVFHALGRT